MFKYFKLCVLFITINMILGCANIQYISNDYLFNEEQQLDSIHHIESIYTQYYANDIAYLNNVYTDGHIFCIINGLKIFYANPDDKFSLTIKGIDDIIELLEVTDLKIYVFIFYNSYDFYDIEEYNILIDALNNSNNDYLVTHYE